MGRKIITEEKGRKTVRILIADDEEEMTQALSAILKHEHYSVDTVHDGLAALDYGMAESCDCLVLDIMMPGLDGLQVLRKLRENGISTPVLLLTAKGEVEDRVAGLNCGADDYLPKPFDVREFLARVRSLTRRGGTFTPQILTVGNVSLNRSTFELSSGGTAVRLGNKEFQMMELLMRRQGQFISTEQFMERIWGYECDSEINVVWAYISYLRRKLASLGADVKITASRGRGYMLEAEGGQ